MLTHHDTLKETVARIRENGRKKKFSSLSLLTNAHGKPFMAETFKSMWGYHMNNALKKKVINERFTFHDIRAMAITYTHNVHGLDAAQKLAGHSSGATTKRNYVRGVIKRKPIK